MAAKKVIGLIGTGLMGAPMARNWLAKGFLVRILPHKNQERAKALKVAGADIAPDLKSLVAGSDVIALMLPTSREVEGICLGMKGSEGLIDLLTPQQIVIDFTTSEPSSTKAIFEAFRQKSLRFMDSPVTGGVKGAEAGTLTLFLGGSSAWIEEVTPVLAAISLTRTHFGDIGSGHIAKIINNFICVGNLAVFSEALPLALRLGLEPDKLFNTLLSGSAASEMLKYYGPQILAGDFSPRFKLEHAFKDIKIAQCLADQEKLELPVLNAMVKDLTQAAQRGLGSENLSALIQIFEEQSHTRFRKPEIDSV